MQLPTSRPKSLTMKSSVSVSVGGAPGLVAGLIAQQRQDPERYFGRERPEIDLRGSMRKPVWFLLSALMASDSIVWAQQYVISTIAGGGPPPSGVAAVNADI